MRELTPTRSTAIELADERKLMRQGYEFLDEKRILLATEILGQLKTYRQRSDELVAANKWAAAALTGAVERHGLDHKVVALPCGHYTTGETPYKYMDGWQLASFLRTAF